MGMIGPNGAGKSTFFHIISGFLRPDRGEIRFQGKAIQGKRPDEICHLGISRTFQLIQNFPKMTALENVMVGAFAHTDGVAHARSKSMEMLAAVQLVNKAHWPVKSLTYAEKKSVELARALATEVQEAIGLFRRIREQRRITLFLVEHIMHAIMTLSDRVIVLHHGEKIAEGTPQEIMKNQGVIESYLGEEELLA
jgi:branched-chain amino acid transport system ATP-binding protein